MLYGYTRKYYKVVIEMKKAIKIKSFKRKYRSIDFFILLILGCMIISFICSYLLKSYEFLSSALLNVCGGLFTGLLILLYQFYSKMKLNEAIEVIRELEAIKEISTEHVDILDFCTDNTLPYMDELEEGVVEIENILSDNEGVASALEKYIKILKEMDKQLKVIMFFSENTLTLPIDFYRYKNNLDATFQYFRKYNIVEVHIPNNYLVRDKDTGDIIDVVSADAQCPNDDLYYIDPPSPEFREANIVYENGVEVDSKKIYEKWIEKMTSLINDTKVLNSKLNNEKESIIEYHNNSIVIN